MVLRSRNPGVASTMSARVGLRNRGKFGEIDLSIRSLSKRAKNKVKTGPLSWVSLILPGQGFRMVYALTHISDLQNDMRSQGLACKTLAYTCDPQSSTNNTFKACKKVWGITRVLDVYRIWPRSSHMEEPQASIQRVSWLPGQGTSSFFFLRK